MRQIDSEFNHEGLNELIAETDFDLILEDAQKLTVLVDMVKQPEIKLENTNAEISPPKDEKFQDKQDTQLIQNEQIPRKNFISRLFSSIKSKIKHLFKMVERQDYFLEEKAGRFKFHSRPEQSKVDKQEQGLESQESETSSEYIEKEPDSPELKSTEPHSPDSTVNRETVKEDYVEKFQNFKDRLMAANQQSSQYQNR